MTLPLISRRALPLLALPSLARAQTPWRPDRPVRLVIPFPAGGTSDVLARAVAERLMPRLGRPVVVDARPGAGGNLGAEVVVRAMPDGHTVFLGGMSSNAINQALYARLPFDPATDLIPIGMFIGIANVLLYNPGKHDFASLTAMLAEARANPGRIAYASNGAGSVTHLTMELLRQAAGGIELLHVPYRGSAPATAGLLAGDVALMLDGAPTAAGQLRGGTLKALGVTTAARLPALPDVPSLAEAGVPGFDVPSWYGMFAPRGTPAAVLAAWREALDAVAAEPDFRALVERNTAALMPMSTTALDAFLAAERTRWAEAVRRSGATAD